jgi:ribosomal protein S18 acetylase RimI-like enzyme
MKLLSLKEHPELKEDFCKLPQTLMSAEEFRLTTRPEYVSKLLELKFPVQAEAFLLQSKQGQLFGRILLQTSMLDPALGHWGLFCISESTEHQQDLEASWGMIEEWFSKAGVKKIIGPYLYTSWFPYRFRIDEAPDAFLWEPNQPRRDYEIFKRLNFQIEQTYFTNFIENFGVFASKGEREYQQAQEQGWLFKSLADMDMEQAIKDIYDLSMAGFTDNYLFSPIPYELFRSIYVPSFQGLDLRMSCLQYAPDGTLAGFNFTFVLNDQIVIKSVCVLPAYRGKGILNAGIRYSMVAAKRFYPQVTKIATALVHEQNAASKHVADQTTERTRHEYVLMSKEIDL